MTPALPLVAVVLPPGEGFGAGRAGAVAMIAHRLAAATADRFRTAFVGAPQAVPVFADIAFHVARPSPWRPGNLNHRYAAAAAGVLRRLRPALIEVHNRPEVALSIARRLPRVPASLFLHNDPQTMRGARTPRERAALIGSMAAIACVSGFIRDRLMDGVAASSRTPIVLPNSIDLDALPPSLPSDARERTFLFVGRVVPEKAPDAFVAACARALPRLPGWRAEIVGADRFRADSPDTPFVRAVRAAAEAAGVAMAGYRPHADVMAAFSRAAIAMVPSRWQEPFGLTALEAMASGAALIAAPRGGLPEVGGDAALYADPDDPAALAEAMLALAADPARRAALAQAGLRRAEGFTLPRAAEELCALRRAILAAASG